MAQPLEHGSFEKPDDVREGANWRLELVNLAGGAQVGRLTLQPGWRWTTDVKPVAGTELCEAPHQQYNIAGHLHVKMQDGTEMESGSGRRHFAAAGARCVGGRRRPRCRRGLAGSIRLGAAPLKSPPSSRLTPVWLRG